jgi:ribonucleoside-triphosphate reductase (thioredoxin)
MKGTQLAADIKFFLDYSKWMEEHGRMETWHDSVKRVMNMHRTNPKFQEAFKDQWFRETFDMTEQLYLDKFILGSNRAFQFGGAPIMKHNAKMYNCLASYCDRVAFFQEAMYWLMCGCGVGYSVQFHHIAKLPNISKRTKGTKTFKPTDDVEGWSNCYGVLMSSYFEGEVTFPEYQGYEVKFDFSGIRTKGSRISGGFKAPGPEGLKQSLERVEALIEARLAKGENRLHSIDCCDIVCHEGDAVLSGGVRRSASICVFSHWDEEMLTAKIAGNYDTQKGINKQRSRVNISAVLVRGEVTWEEFQEIIKRTKDWGEPGFYFVDHRDQVPNPCVEIGMWPQTPEGKSGWQGCNLDVGNGRKITSKEIFMKVATGLAFLGTLQAFYTDFKYVAPESKIIFEKEALLGCGICGWMANPETLLNEEYQREAAQLILQINKRTAGILGTNPAARATCSKPDGNTGVLLEAPSGAGGEEAPHYFRVMQVNKDSEIAKYLQEEVPFMVEESVWSATNSDIVVYIPVEAKEGSIFKKDIIGVKQLEIIKSIQQNWVEYGTDVELCSRPFLRHNVSNTVQVKDWDEVAEYLFNNRQYFSGVSFLSVYGPLDYKQAPFTPVRMPDELLKDYGKGIIFASGLIVDGLHYFDGDLWTACAAVKDKKFKLDGSRAQVLLKKDWIRRAKQFAKNQFKGKVDRMIYCLKEVHLFHKWDKIERELKPMDLSKVILEPVYTDADTQASASCVGGACELPGDWLSKRSDKSTVN